ncbi:hypothetical protein RYO59_002612 [Thermosynechococcaceae cyanobacterium Okahandja]
MPPQTIQNILSRYSPDPPEEYRGSIGNLSELVRLGQVQHYP